MMKFHAFFVVLIFAILQHVSTTSKEKILHDKILFIIMSQPNAFNTKIAEKLKYDILNQTSDAGEQHKVLISPQDFRSVIGHWIIFPLIERLTNLDEFTWAFFLEETTAVSLLKLMKVLKKHKKEKNKFVGFALKDAEPTIIHHYDMNKTFTFPNVVSGMAVSSPILKKSFEKWKEVDYQGFNIDAKYEFAKLLYEQFDQLKLTHEPLFCGADKHDDCATWISNVFPSCAYKLSQKDIFFYVKTCSKFKERAEVVKRTWAIDAYWILLYTDEVDSTFPSYVQKVHNVPSGHCEKTMEIIRHYNNNVNITTKKWLVIADDDTLFSVPRLFRLLSCYNESEAVALGELYGYGSGYRFGYDYLTGGAGMVFSVPAVEMLATDCHCPSANSPDDMIIGRCLKELYIPTVHLPYFHQARPYDYDKNFLKSYTPVSFHKHWMVDPYKVYKTYLQEPTHPDKPSHHDKSTYPDKPSHRDKSTHSGESSHHPDKSTHPGEHGYHLELNYPHNEL